MLEKKVLLIVDKKKTSLYMYEECTCRNVDEQKEWHKMIKWKKRNEFFIPVSF